MKFVLYLVFLIFSFNALASDSNDVVEIGELYKPSKTKSFDKNILIERDDNNIEVISMSTEDSVTVKICNGGISLKLHESIQTDIQDALLDDITFFSAQVFQNKKGAYVKLNKPIPKGSIWESSVRLVRADNDKEYLINLLAVPCPRKASERAKFKKVIYIKDRPNIINQYTKILTPEDTIIKYSEGLPLKRGKDKLRVVDMITNAGSEHAIFSVEIIPDENKDKHESIDLMVLNDKQVNLIKSTIRFLETSSKVITKKNGKMTSRFQLIVNIDKNYIQTNKYIYFIYINRESNHYQYFKIDVLKRFNKLKKAGWRL